MKKLNLFALAAIVMLTLGVSKNANSQISVGLTGGVGLPMGEFGDKAKGAAETGFGGGIQGRYAINDNIHAGIGLGYYMFKGPEFDLSALGGPKFTSSYSIMPITLSGEYYFMTDGFKPFATIDLGMYGWGSKVESSAYTVSGVNFPATTTEKKETKFGFGIGAGAAYGLSDNLDIMGSLKYNSFSATSGTSTISISWIGINVGVAMKFGN